MSNEIVNQLKENQIEWSHYPSDLFLEFASRLRFFRSPFLLVIYRWKKPFGIFLRNRHSTSVFQYSYPFVWETERQRTNGMCLKYSWRRWVPRCSTFTVEEKLRWINISRMDAWELEYERISWSIAVASDWCLPFFSFIPIVARLINRWRLVVIHHVFLNTEWDKSFFYEQLCWIQSDLESYSHCSFSFFRCHLSFWHVTFDDLFENIFRKM